MLGKQNAGKYVAVKACTAEKKREEPPRGHHLRSIYIHPFSNRFPKVPSVGFLACQRVRGRIGENVLLLRVKAKKQEWGCDVRHTMCYARNTKQRGVTLVTPCVAVVTALQRFSLQLWAGLQWNASFWRILFLHPFFFPFHTCFSLCYLK